MSGHIGDYRSKSRFQTSLQVQPAAPEIMINKSLFTFQYGGGTHSCNYTLPTLSGGGSTPLGHRRWYRLRVNFGDFRWNSECIVLGSQNYFGTGGNTYNYWNTLVVATSGAISVTNGNGGSSGDLTAELQVFEILGLSHPHHYTYTGGS